MNRFGFLKVAAAVPHVRIADCDYNAQHITELIRKGADRGASIILFPELCITSYTCGDLIQQPALLQAAEQALDRKSTRLNSSHRSQSRMPSSA